LILLRVGVRASGERPTRDRKTYTGHRTHEPRGAHPQEAAGQVRGSGRDSATAAREGRTSRTTKTKHRGRTCASATESDGRFAQQTPARAQSTAHPQHSSPTRGTRALANNAANALTPPALGTLGFIFFGLASSDMAADCSRGLGRCTELRAIGKTIACFFVFFRATCRASCGGLVGGFGEVSADFP
jgi:hypothetical protein